MDQKLEHLYRSCVRTLKSLDRSEDLLDDLLDNATDILESEPEIDEKTDEVFDVENESVDILRNALGCLRASSLFVADVLKDLEHQLAQYHRNKPKKPEVQ